MPCRSVLLQSADDSGRELTRLEAVAKGEHDECWLQELLYRRPELIPAGVFGSLYADPIPLGREVSTPRGPVDVLYVGAEGGLILVETKLWKNPEKHRTVVAQIIDYAKELAAWDYDRLSAAVLRASRNHEPTAPASLEQRVQPALDRLGIPLHEFQEQVALNLAEGNFLLLIAGDRISPNIALLTRAIQSAPHLGFTLGLVELQMYATQPDADWPLLVVPEIVGRTVETPRGTVRIRYEQEKPQVSVETEDEEPGTSGGPLDPNTFLKQIPADLVSTFRQGLEKWQQTGGELDFKQKIFLWTIRLGDRPVEVIRTRADNISIVTRKAFDGWSLPDELYAGYLDQLEKSPTLAQFARTDRVRIRYSELSADDLRTLFDAAVWLAERARSADGDQ